MELRRLLLPQLPWPPGSHKDHKMARITRISNVCLPFRRLRPLGYTAAHRHRCTSQIPVLTITKINPQTSKRFRHAHLPIPLAQDRIPGRLVNSGHRLHSAQAQRPHINSLPIHFHLLARRSRSQNGRLLYIRPHRNSRISLPTPQALHRVTAHICA
jgi:hypothetical protein